jgi:5-methylcytosine-specific restriction endonuclease McrA
MSNESKKKEYQREYQRVRRQSLEYREYQRIHQKEYYQKHKEKVKERHQTLEYKEQQKRYSQSSERREREKELNKLQRIKTLMLLGSRCVVCGNYDQRVLEIDHILPLAGEKRITSAQLYSSIIAGNTDNLQLLCANCHRIKTYDS